MTNTDTMTTDHKQELRNKVIVERNRMVKIVDSEIIELNHIEKEYEKYFSEIKKYSRDFELVKTVRSIGRQVKVNMGSERIAVDEIIKEYNECKINYIGELPEGTNRNLIYINVKEHITYSRGGWRPNRQGAKLCINLGEKDQYYKCVRTFVKKIEEYVESIWSIYRWNLEAKNNKKMVVEVAKEKFSHNSVVTMMSSNVLCVTYDNGTKVEMYYKVNDTTKEVAFTIRNTKIETPKNQDDLFKLLDTLGKL
jgi:hypothetical protein